MKGKFNITKKNNNPYQGDVNAVELTQKERHQVDAVEQLLCLCEK